MAGNRVVDYPAIEQFLCGVISDHVPDQPGLYLYFPDYKDEFSETPPVHLVEIRTDPKEGFLIADSDAWYTFFPLDLVQTYMPGIWTRPITF